MSCRTLSCAAGGAALLVLAAYGGYYAHDVKDRHCWSKYHFINAEVACHGGGVISKAGYAGLQSTLETYIAEQKKSGSISEVALYFRDLENGPVFGINETADFAPASLLKLPLALVYLTQAERNPEVLQEEVSVVNPEWNFYQSYPSSEKIDPRQPHTIEELLIHMLKYSDNDAYGVLQTQIYELHEEDLMKNTFLELGFISPTDITDEVLSVRRYAGILRALYNSSYVNADLSEKVLAWLSGSMFNDGIVGGVPQTIEVAHKFGERILADGAKQLHDCGIIYYPDNPYLLCVMTKGRNFTEMATVIRHISSELYKEIDSRKL
jgi:beta-lactamase class A